MKGPGQGLPRVGVDLRLWQHSGMGRWLQGLLPALASRGWPMALWGQPGHLEAIGQALPGLPLRACPHPPLRPWDLAFWPKALRQAQAEALFWPHLDAPPTGGLPLVVAVHDLIPWRWPGSLRPGAARYQAWRLAWSLARARGVVVHAPHVAEELASRLGWPLVRSQVAPPGLDPAWARGPRWTQEELRARLGLGPGPWVVGVGLWKPHKDWPTLVRGASLAAKALPGLELCLVGVPDPRARELWAAIAQARAEGLKVHHPGWLPEEALRGLLKGALGMGFPSRAEGFGLPPLEALAHGCPVLAAEGPWLEASVGPHAWRLPPGEPTAWAQGLVALAGEEAAARAKRMAAAQAWVEAKTWAACADGVEVAWRAAFLREP